jgi:hypothetical protein
MRLRDLHPLIRYPICCVLGCTALAVGILGCLLTALAAVYIFNHPYICLPVVLVLMGSALGIVLFGE